MKIKICLKVFTNGFDLNIIPKTLPDFVGTPLKGRWCRKKHLDFFDKCSVETKASLPFKGGARRAEGLGITGNQTLPDFVGTPLKGR